jgi:hypothetical protein
MKTIRSSQSPRPFVKSSPMFLKKEELSKASQTKVMQLTEENARLRDEVSDLISYRQFVSSAKKEKLPILESLDDFSFAFADCPENLTVLIEEDLRAQLTRLAEELNVKTVEAVKSERRRSECEKSSRRPNKWWTSYGQ